MNELENREKELNIDKTKMLFKGYKAIYDFAKFEIVQIFGDAIKNGVITTDIANDKVQQLATKIKEFANSTKPRNVNMKKVKQSIQNSPLAFLKERQMVFNTFRSGIFLVPLEESEGESDELFP